MSVDTTDLVLAGVAAILSLGYLALAILSLYWGEELTWVLVFGYIAIVYVLLRRTRELRKLIEAFGGGD